MGLGLNLDEQLVFYGTYHSNKWNQLIHFVFVPAIVWSAAVWLAYTNELFHLDVASYLPESSPAWAYTLAK